MDIQCETAETEFETEWPVTEQKSLFSILEFHWGFLQTEIYNIQLRGQSIVSAVHVFLCIFHVQTALLFLI
jgi:hypothetical protein